MLQSLRQHRFRAPAARSLSVALARSFSTTSHIGDAGNHGRFLNLHKEEDRRGESFMKKKQPPMFVADDVPKETPFAPQAAAFDFSRMLSVKDMQRSDIEIALRFAAELGQASRIGGKWRDGAKTTQQLDLLSGRVLANLFFEPSTRTSSSFATAMLRMGGSYLNLNATTSSAKKGESLSDTIKVMSEYADVLVVRHPDVDVFGALDDIRYPGIPILNAGNGSDEHPTQALLDLLCIQSELGHIDGLTITLAGDLKHGRTVHSLSYVLSRFDNIKLYLVSPPELRLPTEWLGRLLVNNPTMQIIESNSYQKVLGKTDVLYMTRIQQERFDSAEAYEAVKGSFELTAADLKGSRALVMHPLPRVNEIRSDVDVMPNARYFEQVGYGVVMRMALLGLALGAKPSQNAKGLVSFGQ